MGKRWINIIHIMGQTNGKGFVFRKFDLHPMFHQVSGNLRFKSLFEVFFRA